MSADILNYVAYIIGLLRCVQLCGFFGYCIQLLAKLVLRLTNSAFWMPNQIKNIRYKLEKIINYSNYSNIRNILLKFFVK